MGQVLANSFSSSLLGKAIFYSSLAAIALLVFLLAQLLAVYWLFRLGRGREGKDAKLAIEVLLSGTKYKQIKEGGLPLEGALERRLVYVSRSAYAFTVFFIVMAAFSLISSLFSETWSQSFSFSWAWPTYTAGVICVVFFFLYAYMLREFLGSLKRLPIEVSELPD